MRSQEYRRLREAENELWWFRALRLFIGKILSGYLNEKTSVLDIGCGTGGLMRELGGLDRNVFGLDYSATALGFAQQLPSTGLLRANGNEIPLSRAFDLVISVDLLEIAGVDPQRLVDGALRVLRPGGHALFVAAAHQWLLSEHDRAVNSTRRFTTAELKDLFSRTDVKVLRTTYLFFFLFPVMALRKLLNPMRPKANQEQTRSDIAMPPATLNNLLFVLCWLEAQLLSVLNLPIGTSALILVQKIA